MKLNTKLSGIVIKQIFVLTESKRCKVDMFLKLSHKFLKIENEITLSVLNVNLNDLLICNHQHLLLQHLINTNIKSLE